MAKENKELKAKSEKYLKDNGFKDVLLTYNLNSQARVYIKLSETLADFYEQIKDN